MKEFLKKVNSNITKEKEKLPILVFQKLSWKNMFENKKGCNAIYTSTDKKNKPILVVVDTAYDHHVVLKTKKYDESGKLRTDLNISVTYTSLLCKESKVVFIDE